MKSLCMSLVLVGLLAAAVQPAPAADEARRSRRGLKAIEQVVNEMLVDSRNVLVMSSEAARAHVLPDYGVVVTFETSLLGDGAEWRWNDWRGGRIRREGDVFVFDMNRDADADSEAAAKAEEKAKQHAEAKAKDKAAGKSAAERYAGFKKEMVDALVESADYTRALKDETWLVLSAALERNDYFREQGLRQFQVRARLADLDAYAEGKLAERALRERIVAEEF